MPGKRFRSLQDPETLEQLVRNLREGIYITNGSGEILDANPAFLEIFGVSTVEELRRYRAQELFVDPEQRRQEAATLARDGELRDFEIQVRRPDGAELTVLDTCYAVRDPETGEMLYHGILIDITRRKQLEERLHDQSVHDPLTGCYNRRFLAEAERCLAGGLWATIAVDIDNFKEYNDQHGHQRGDEILVSVGRFLMRHVRAEDAVVRMGGDEFLVLLLGSGAANCSDAVSRLKQAAFEESIIPFSLGWAVREGGERLEQTIGRADRELLQIRVWERRVRRRRIGRA